MRSIFLVDTYYQAVIDSLGFGSGVNLTSGYKDAVDTLVDYGFGTGGAYRRELIALGWDARISVPNAPALQKKWLQESQHSAPISKGWSYGLYAARVPLLRRFLHLIPHIQGTLYKQIVALQPDVVFVQDLNILTPQMAKAIRQHTRLLVGEIASPLPPKPYFTRYDLIISALPSIVDRVRAWGGKSEYVPLAFDSQRAVYSPASQRPIDAIFVGSFSRHQPQTLPLLQAVAQRVPGFHIYGPASETEIREAGLTEFYKGQAWGQDMFDLLGNSKVVVNRHGTIAGDYAVNMRMFEATGCGAALVTENKSNLTDLFTPGSEVFAYDNPDQAAETVNRTLRNPKLLDTVALNGQKRTLTSHTYAERAETLSQLLESYLQQTQ